MISIVVPLYNKGKSIGKTISSILAQTYQDFEIIIVDDGSTDNSLKEVKGISDNHIRILQQRNNGVSAARNYGIRHAKHDYVALLDGDDLWYKTFLQEMYSFIQSFPDAALYGCAYSFQNPDKNITTPYLGLENLFQGYIDYFSLAKYNTLFTSSSVVFRKDAFFAIGGYNTNYTKGEDIDLWIRFALHEKVAFYNRPLSIINLNSENRSFLKPAKRERCLIWNLERYKADEKNNIIFKEFLDSWRLAHVHNYLTGNKNEIDEISSLLKDIELKNYSFIWTLLKSTPAFLQPFTYRAWNKVKELIR